ncbi:PQQ-dependent sugar dehydrogenase [Gluconobacter morbifer]|uniref:Pyrroloquinoline quinone-dependent pyranose dehydrogenase beta-propeller domain-containing protein n=1 Tax=Gluconobacter morbifer G707 TaxID=1088869 RepID=G6XH54_9PROT|nr:hypothetical protein GMO_08190 [Gluconobacter morbifer G707]
MAQGNVYAIPHIDQNSHPLRVFTLAKGLNTPAGVAFHNGDLYISDTDRILVLRDIENHLDSPAIPEVITDRLPYKDGDHFWKFIAFGPDNRLYVPIGAPCNICDVGHDFAKIISMNLDGSDIRDVAYGIRNSVGLTWQPQSNKLWFTDNGRDMMGDDVPSDELNQLSHIGASYGYPYCHQGNIPDPVFGKQHSCHDFTPPALLLGAHVAALGLRFYNGKMFPADYQGNLLIAEHGSWNRSVPSGYQVVSVHFSGMNHPEKPTLLVGGFRRKNHVRGSTSRSSTIT